MRWDRIREGWDDIGEQVRARWQLLDAAEVQAIGGDRDSLLAVICERYQLPRQTVEWQISAWQNAYTDRWLYGGPAQLH